VYEKYYQFKSLPFRLSPDPSFFFGSKGHNRALSYLRYGLTQKEGFIVITGTPGTGKTTIARSLLQEIGKEKIVVSELNTTHLQAEDVLRMVAASFGLEHENVPKATILKRLESFFTSRFRAGYHVLLMVDESQNLPPESLEELRMLSNFYLGKDALIQIFLLGQQQFRDNLYSKKMEQLRQRVVASCHLEPLNITETREYIEFRLKRVGWDGDPEISDRAFARIFSYTKGVPRRINTFCDRLFLFGAIEEVHHFQDEHVKEVAKELAYEVSAEGVQLEDITPEAVLADEDIALGSVTLNKMEEEPERDVLLDTEQLKKFSDDVNDELSKQVIESELDEAVTTVIADNGLEEFYPSSETGEGERKENILQFSSNDNTAKKLDAAPLSATVTSLRPAQNKSPNWWELLTTCVEYYKQPAKFRGVAVGTHSIEGVSELLQVASGNKEIPDYVRTGIIENLNDNEIRDAIRLYIQNVLLCNSSDYYRRLGVRNNASMELIKTHYKLMFPLFQPEATVAGDWDETYIRRINQAYSTLRDVDKREEYEHFLATRNRGVQQRDDGPGIDDNAGRLELEDHTEQSALAAADNLKAKLHEPSKIKWSLVASISVMLFGGLAAVYMYQPEVKQFLAFGEAKNSVNEVIETNERIATAEVKPVVKKVTESAELEKILEPVESIFIPKPDTIKEIASAVEKTFKSNIDSSSSESGSVAAEKKVLQARIERKAPEAKKEIVSRSTPSPAPPLVKKVEKQDNSSRALGGDKLAMLTPAPVITSPESTAKSRPIAKIANTELKSFVTDFSIAYEEGDLNGLMRFFAKNAVVNDSQSKQAIKADYESLFSSTDMRVIDLHGLSWDIRKQTAVGQGEFLITVLRKGSETMKNFSGTIKLEVKKTNGKLMLVGMKHTYGLEN